MNDGDSFFVYLPSNVDTEGRYDDINESSHYFVPLNEPLLINENWEVGLSEIFFPNYSYNVLYPMNQMIFIWYKHSTNIGSRVMGRIKISEGSFNPKQFVKHVNHELKILKISSEGGSKPAFQGRLSYNAQRKKIDITLAPREKIAFTHPLMRRMMGFGPKDPVFVENRTDKDKTFALSHCCNFHVNGNHMFVYANIVNSSRIADNKAPLLRVVSLNAREHEDNIHREYKNSHYFRLSSNYIQEIEIMLCNTEGEYMQFVNGDSLLVLHFRRRPERKEN